MLAYSYCSLYTFLLNSKTTDSTIHIHKIVTSKRKNIFRIIYFQVQKLQNVERSVEFILKINKKKYKIMKMNKFSKMYSMNQNFIIFLLLQIRNVEEKVLETLQNIVDIIVSIALFLFRLEWPLIRI